MDKRERRRYGWAFRLLAFVIVAAAIFLANTNEAEALTSSCITIESPVNNKSYTVNQPIDIYFDILDPYKQSDIQALVYLQVWYDGKLDSETQWTGVNGGLVPKNSKSGWYKDYLKYYGYSTNPFTMKCSKKGTYQFKIVCKPYNTKTKKIDTSIKESAYPTKSVTFTVKLKTPTASFDNKTVSKTCVSSKFTNKFTTNSNGTVTYTSSDKNVATVNSKGQVTIKGAGTATIKASVKATSTYAAKTATYTLTVSKASPTLTFKSSSVNRACGDKNFTNTLTKKTDGKVTFSSDNAKVATVDSKGQVTIKGVGTAKITAKAAAGTKYKSKSTSYTLTVKKGAPKTVTLSKTAYTYDGKEKKPGVTVTNKAGKTLKNGTDYKVTYQSGRKNVGKYTVTVTMKGNYTGEESLSFTIKPPKTSISSLTAGSKKFTVKWSKKTTQVTGYQIQYSTSSKFSSTKSVTVKTNSTTSKLVTGLTPGKKYYVRIRTYKTVNGTNYYSGWSDAKNVTAK